VSVCRNQINRNGWVRAGNRYIVIRYIVEGHNNGYDDSRRSGRSRPSKIGRHADDWRLGRSGVYSMAFGLRTSSPIRSPLVLFLP